VLVKTSNASSGELQDLPVGDEAVHEHMAQLVESWATECIGPESNLSSVGAVVGATYPEELKYLRTLMPHCIFLIPGYGAQGGTAADIKHGFIGAGLPAEATQGGCEGGCHREFIPWHYIFLERCRLERSSRKSCKGYGRKHQQSIEYGDRLITRQSQSPSQSPALFAVDEEQDSSHLRQFHQTPFSFHLLSS